jgi:hypothetical protein
VFRSFDEEQRAEHDYWRALAPADRLAMMWQLALDAWSFTGQPGAESRLPRSVVRIHRRER